MKINIPSLSYSRYVAGSFVFLRQTSGYVLEKMRVGNMRNRAKANFINELAH
jgi:hypothetical protein